METREVFEGLAPWEIAVWYTLVAISTAVFAWGVARLVQKYRHGRRMATVDHPVRRFVQAAAVVFRQSTLRQRHALAGLAHALTFYGFLVLFIGTVILAINDDVTRPFFGFDFWHGAFYLGYSLFLDIFGAALTCGLVVLAVIRGVVRPFRLDYRRPDRTVQATGDGRQAPGDPLLPAAYRLSPVYVVGDWVFVGALFLLALTGFLIEAVRIAERNPSFEIWSPVGWVVAQGFRGLGLRGAAAAQAHFALWWVHGVVALAFVASIP